MVTWGKTKKNQAYVKDKPNGMSGSTMNTNPTSDVHMKETEKRFKHVEIWKFDDAPEEVKQKILEKHRDINVTDAQMLTDGDWLLDSDIFDWDRNKVYFDLDRGQYIQFNNLSVKDPESFRKLLGISKPLWKKISFTFKNWTGGGSSATNTAIEFTEESDRGYSELDEYGKGGELSEKESEQISQAYEKFSDMIHKSWVGLRDTYEAQMSDEDVGETLRINEYDFDENGDIV
jgi:hypothetical protein